jgi:hypothetical protein
MVAREVRSVVPVAVWMAVRRPLQRPPATVGVRSAVQVRFGGQM